MANDQEKRVFNLHCNVEQLVTLNFLSNLPTVCYLNFQRPTPWHNGKTYSTENKLFLFDIQYPNCTILRSSGVTSGGGGENMEK